jgi:hypothetical protein
MRKDAFSRARLNAAPVLYAHASLMVCAMAVALGEDALGHAQMYMHCNM